MLEQLQHRKSLATHCSLSEGSNIHTSIICSKLHLLLQQLWRESNLDDCWNKRQAGIILVNWVAMVEVEYWFWMEIFRRRKYSGSNEYTICLKGFAAGARKSVWTLQGWEERERERERG